MLRNDKIVSRTPYAIESIISIWRTCNYMENLIKNLYMNTMTWLNSGIVVFKKWSKNPEYRMDMMIFCQYMCTKLRYTVVIHGHLRWLTKKNVVQALVSPVPYDLSLWEKCRKVNEQTKEKHNGVDWGEKSLHRLYSLGISFFLYQS